MQSSCFAWEIRPLAQFQEPPGCWRSLSQPLQLTGGNFLSFRHMHTVAYHWPNMDIFWVLQTEDFPKRAHCYLSHRPKPIPFAVSPSQRLAAPSTPLPRQKYGCLYGPTCPTTTALIQLLMSFFHLKIFTTPLLSAGKQTWSKVLYVLLKENGWDLQQPFWTVRAETNNENGIAER